MDQLKIYSMLILLIFTATALFVLGSKQTKRLDGTTVQKVHVFTNGVR